jgi:hypothetical protein
VAQNYGNVPHRHCTEVGGLYHFGISLVIIGGEDLLEVFDGFTQHEISDDVDHFSCVRSQIFVIFHLLRLNLKGCHC